MTLDVDPAELRSAAKKLSAAADPLACRVVPSDGVTEEKVGHVELTGWITSVLEHCREANDQLSRSAEGMAGGLRTSADDYEARDTDVKGLFDSSPLTGPFGTGTSGGSPFQTPTFGQPGTGFPVLPSTGAPQ